MARRKTASSNNNNGDKHWKMEWFELATSVVGCVISFSSSCKMNKSLLGAKAVHCDWEIKKPPTTPSGERVGNGCWCFVYVFLSFNFDQLKWWIVECFRAFVASSAQFPDVHWICVCVYVCFFFSGVSREYSWYHIVLSGWMEMVKLIVCDVLPPRYTTNTHTHTHTMHQRRQFVYLKIRNGW